MAFFQLVLKANKLEKIRQSYEDEKLTSIEIAKGAKKPAYTLKQRIRRRKLWFKKKVKHFFNKIFIIRKASWMYKRIVATRTDGTLENYIIKSFLGFIGGILLTYIFFIFFVFQLNFKLSSATFVCTIIGAILTMGLAFSPRVRCIVLLVLPQFFSKRGRQALMAYAFILALTGPMKNTLHNIGVLSESLTCAQEQLKEAVKTVIDLAKQPFYALREAISKVIRTIKAIVKKIKQTLIAIKRLVLSILKVITSVFQWLGSIINICNKKLGTPFDRCQNVFEGAIADCKAKLGPFFGVICNITYIVSTLCYIVKPLDFICMLVSYIADSVVGAVRSRIQKFTMHMKAMFYVKVKFSHSFHFETNQSKTIEEVSTSITKEIRSRTDKLFGFFDWMSFVTSFFVFFILLRVMRYRYKWLTSERFDNRYITNDLRTIDLIRARQDKETVLPLNSRERNKYVPLTSVILIKSERIQLARSMVFLSLNTINLITYMSMDYSLYWVLHTIQIYGRFRSKVERSSVVTMHVSGDGYLAELYKSIVKAFTPHGKEAEINTMLCLPDPVPPDLDKYTQIVIIILFCWLIAVFEPYGLRLRQVVMCQYYPDRAKQRATWLYNYIIRSRGSFLKFARRQLRRKFGLSEGEKVEKVTLKERLWAMCPLLNKLFPLKQTVCLLCGAVERFDHNPHVKCPTPGCIGLFCAQCFADLQNLCTICRSPMDYGDLSDMSEEKDSSEDQFEIPKPIGPVIKEGELKLEEGDKPVEKKDEEIIEEEKEKEEKETEVSTEEEEEEKEAEAPTEEEEEEKETEEPTEEEEEEEEEEEKETEAPTEEEEEEEKETEIPTEEEEDEEEKETEVPTEEEEKKGYVKLLKMEKDVAEQTDDKYLEDTDPSTESTYSYTYQEESPEEIEIEKPRKSFKDVEAQKIKDDVTIQIFNQPFVKEPSSSSESPTSSFVVRAHRKVRAKLKKPPATRAKDSDSSTSIGDTESLSSEKVDEEEVIHIEVDDGLEELLPKDYGNKKKLGRINRIVDAVARIPWLGKEENNEKAPEGLRRKRPSLMNRIVDMLHRKQSLPVRSYRRSRRITDSSSCSSCSCDDENESLLDKEDRDVGITYFARNKSRKRSTRGNYDDNLTGKVLCERKFTTKPLPRYLESVAKGTSYYELDETKGSGTRTCVRQVENINELSDIKGYCSCTSEITYQGNEDEDVYSLDKSTMLGQTDLKSETTNEAGIQIVSKSDTGYTKETESTINISKPRKNMKGNFSDNVKSKGLRKINDQETELEEEVNENVLKDKMESQEESATIYTETDSSPLYNPFAGTIHKLRKKITPIMKPGILKEKFKLSKENEKVSERNLKMSNEKSKIAEQNRTTSTEKSMISEQKIDNNSEKILTNQKSAGRKIDKSTDLPDKSKYVQAKFDKHDRKYKFTDQDTRMSDAKMSNKLFEESSKGRKRKKEDLSKKKDKKRCKYDRVKHGTSKRRKCSCSEKSTFTEDEEIYSSEYKLKTSRFDTETTEKASGSEDYECECHLEMKQRFDMPVVKRYLPMYQSPQLIEELKRHDRMRLIRENETRTRRFGSSFRSSDSISANTKMRNQRNPTLPDDTERIIKEGYELPYQKVQTYKNVLRELKKKVGAQKRDKEPENSVPLIRLSPKSHKSKMIKQLYPSQNQTQKKTNVVKKFADKIITPLKPFKSKRHKYKVHKRKTGSKEIGSICYDCSCDAEILSETSSTCSCLKKTHKSDISTSTDELTDNN